MSRALVLIGHGSARNPNTRLPICQNVCEIRAMGVYDEVICGLWKEEPRIAAVPGRLKSDEITVVPFFMADGYYTRQVIPGELGLNGAVTRRDGRLIRYTGAVGGHPLFAELILSHARAAGWTVDDALAVLGHGTPRNRDSGRNIYLQTDRIRRAHPGQELLTLFIDEEPRVTAVWDFCRARRIFVVPLFAADGWHVTETIPEDLGLEGGEVHRDGRELRMTSAVGTDPGLSAVILALAKEAEGRPLPPAEKV
jgi:sirohydrochlorin cobaltochelatase